MPGMDVLRRVRWGNVGRAATVVLALTVVIAWPRLASDAPRVPAAGVVPLDRGPYPARKTGAKRPTVPTGGGARRGRRDQARRDDARGAARRRAARRRRNDARRDDTRGAAPRRRRNGARQKARREDARRGVARRGEAPRVDPPTEAGRTARPNVVGRVEKPGLDGRDDASSEAPPSAPPAGEAPAPPDPDPVGAEFGFETSGP
jgi:hypothetical protein